MSRNELPDEEGRQFLEDELYLKDPSREMEADAMLYRNEYIEFGETHINGSLGFYGYDDYGKWLDDVIAARRKITSATEVPAMTFFSMRKHDNKIIGTIQLRLELNEDFRKRGGHIGYGIRPSERGKGYGTKQLSLVLEKAREFGIARVMISCDTTNFASARVAVKNGGVLEWEGYDEEDGYIQIYWIDLS